MAARLPYLERWPRGARRAGAWAPCPLLRSGRVCAVGVGEALPADSLLGAVAGADKVLIAGVRLFDRYAGPGIEPGKLSLAVEVTLQPTTATLTEAEIEAVSAKVIAAAGKLGASLRG